MLEGGGFLRWVRLLRGSSSFVEGFWRSLSWFGAENFEFCSDIAAIWFCSVSRSSISLRMFELPVVRLGPNIAVVREQSAVLQEVRNRKPRVLFCTFMRVWWIRSPVQVCKFGLLVVRSGVLLWGGARDNVSRLSLAPPHNKRPEQKT